MYVYTVNNYMQVTGMATGENFAFFIYRGSPTSTVSTSTISTSTIFIAIAIKSVLVEFSRFCYVVKFVLVEIAM